MSTHPSRRDYMKVAGAAGFAVSFSNNGFSFEVNKTRREIEDPMLRLTPLRAPHRPVKEAVPGFLWIDAGQFNSYGGWELDTFHTDLSAATGYLLANRFAGPPVEDAVTSVSIPHGGTWHLWVRTRNWLPEHSPGQFKVLVNGKDSEQIFGAAASDQWMWEPGGALELLSGTTELRLRDLTGHLGRVSALVLTRDATYRPPPEREAMLKERARLCGVSLTPKEYGSFDVIVAGGGPAGFPAAVAAARNGCRVALIHDRPVLGGNASLEISVPNNGAAFHQTFTRETGIIEELRNEASIHSPRKIRGKVSYAMEFMVANEPNITLFLNENVDAVAMDGKRVRAVESHNTLTGERSAFRGNLFIDCTGDGWLGYYAGAEYRLGREARSEFNESLAPEVADNKTMSGTLSNGSVKPGFFYHVVNRKEPVAFSPPAWAVKIPNPELFHEKRRMQFEIGGSWFQYPGAVDDLFGQEEARDYLYRIVAGVWDFFKNYWVEKEKAANWMLLDIPSTVGMRETRRLVGDHILNQNEVERAELFEDRVAYAGWKLDVHHPDGYTGYERFTAYKKVPVNHIPYRCLYSKNIDNLLFAGRNGSFSAMALGAVRVQVTCASMGQAVGTAAALCRKHGCSPRDVYLRHLTKLQQQLLKEDQYIIGLVNEDPADKARGATARASGSATPANGPENVINGIARPLGDTFNGWESRPLTEAPQWIELEFAKREKINSIHLIFDTGLKQRWPMLGTPEIKGLVKGYLVQCFDGSVWQTVVADSKNYQRRVVCRFQTLETKKIRVIPETTYGDPTAKIYEIRVYDEPA